jgi:hypothetical protein
MATMTSSITSAIIGPIAELLSQLVIVSEDSTDDSVGEEMVAQIPVRIDTGRAAGDSAWLQCCSSPRCA